MRQGFQFEVLKEPRGFIKVIQVLIAIFAFATCTGYRGKIEISQTCPTGQNHLSSADFKYPFQQKISFNIMDCSNNGSSFVTYLAADMDYKSSTEYFVVIGVFCFLYALGMLSYYIAFEPESPPATEPKISAPVLDFIISAIFVLFWFTSAIACAAAITGLKGMTDTVKLIKNMKLCSGTCETLTSGNYATMDISALLGFLNVFVWAGNMWFLFKETPWHSPRGKAAATVSGPGGRDQPAIQTPPAAAI